MASEPRTIRIPDDNELAHVLDEANGAPLRLIRGDVIYRVCRDTDDVVSAYDPERVLAAIQAAAGTLSPDEGEALKAFLATAREEGSRPSTRP